MLYKINQFDRIKLRTTKRIKYLSSPSGAMPSPQGIWSVVGGFDKDLLVCKDGALCRVPISDTIIVGRSKIDHLKDLLNGEERERES